MRNLICSVTISQERLSSSQLDLCESRVEWNYGSDILIIRSRFVFLHTYVFFLSFFAPSVRNVMYNRTNNCLLEQQAED